MARHELFRTQTQRLLVCGSLSGASDPRIAQPCGKRCDKESTHCGGCGFYPIVSSGNLCSGLAAAASSCCCKLQYHSHQHRLRRPILLGTSMHQLRHLQLLMTSLDLQLLRMLELKLSIICAPSPTSKFCLIFNSVSSSISNFLCFDLSTPNAASSFFLWHWLLNPKWEAKFLCKPTFSMLSNFSFFLSLQVCFLLSYPFGFFHFGCLSLAFSPFFLCFLCVSIRAFTISNVGEFSVNPTFHDLKVLHYYFAQFVSSS